LPIFNKSFDNFMLFLVKIQDLYYLIQQKIYSHSSSQGILLNCFSIQYNNIITERKGLIWFISKNSIVSIYYVFHYFISLFLREFISKLIYFKILRASSLAELYLLSFYLKYSKFYKYSAIIAPRVWYFWL
jgi:hypothetical protein